MFDTENRTESKLRLFLSVDISGSTALKNDRNHTKLVNTYKDRRKTFQKLSQKPEGDGQGQIELKQFTLDDGDTCVKTILYDWAIDNYDWAEIIKDRLKGFHGTFQKAIENSAEIKGLDISEGLDSFLWKAVGDEFIYVFEISEYEVLHKLTVCFLMALYACDKEEIKKGLIRFKASAWVAGFPIRNRRIHFQGPDLYVALLDSSRRQFEPQRCGADGQCLSPANCPRFRRHSWPKIDYIGPEIDTGFRIGKHTYDGLMVVSFELACMLGKIDKDLQQVRGAIVGWEKLKGVWNNKPYPIIWITLPENYLADYQPFGQFSESAADENRFVKEWKRQVDRGLKQISKISESIKRARNELSDDLGVIEPYLTGIDSIPPDHQLILDIVGVLYPADEGPQNQQLPEKTGPREDKSAAEEKLKNF